MTDKRQMSFSHLGILCSQTIRMGGGRGEWHAVIWCCSLQTCSDRLHMPGNLEFISPPFLISATVIQINSNEISRGKALFGWGVCSSLQLGPNLRSSWRPNNPSALACGRVSLRCCHSQTLSLYDKLLKWLASIFCAFMNFHSRSVHSVDTRWNQQREISWKQSLTNGQ